MLEKEQYRLIVFNIAIYIVIYSLAGIKFNKIKFKKYIRWQVKNNNKNIHHFIIFIPLPISINISSGGCFMLYIYIYIFLYYIFVL